MMTNFFTPSANLHSIATQLSRQVPRNMTSVLPMDFFYPLVNDNQLTAIPRYNKTNTNTKPLGHEIHHPWVQHPPPRARRKTRSCNIKLFQENLARTLEKLLAVKVEYMLQYAYPANVQSEMYPITSSTTLGCQRLMSIHLELNYYNAWSIFWEAGMRVFDVSPVTSSPCA